ncbi:hypothetical protein GLOIN_2v1481471 [Rhizophagus irregularis DAOM 181602=DAOM 197198]|nr:hypothetical protein GLOIN_2v1481471 [Rhizophagus irregularis DAOM 181602=DAOM 197198]
MRYRDFVKKVMKIRSNARQSLNLPWLNAQVNGANSNRSSQSPRGATLRMSRRGKTTLAQMNQPARNQNLSAALEANPIPSMTNSTAIIPLLKNKLTSDILYCSFRNFEPGLELVFLERIRFIKSVKHFPLLNI